MGLFSKKPVQVDYDPQQSEINKKRMRELFNDAVVDGDTYHILYGGSSTSQINRGFFLDTRVTTFYCYILGWREEDYKVVVVEVDSDMTQHGEPVYITMDQIKATNYYSKLKQPWFIYKDGPQHGVGMQITDRSSTAYSGLKNLYQAEEREQFLDFFERYTEKLRQMGFKFSKWKR